jgi:hypothetical protein
LTSNGSITFGSSPSGSIVTNSGNLTLTPGTTGSVVVANPNVEVTVGTGNLSFASGTDLSIVIDSDGLGGSLLQRLTASGNVNLANVDLLLSGSYTPVIGNQFIIVNNTSSGVTSGTFNGLPEGTIFNPSITNTAPPKPLPANLNADFRITYVGGTGNDVVLTVINIAPTLDTISDPPTILEGAGLQTINLSGISAGGTISQVLTVSAVSDNPALIASPVAVNYTSPSATGSLSYTPEADQFGTAVIVVTVQDDGGAPNTVNRTFTVRVAEVNDAPTGFDDPSAAITEDSGDRVIPFADLLLNDLKGPDNESGQMLTITAVNNVVGGTARIEGTDVIFTPAADFNGAASFTYTMTDDGTTNGGADPKSATATVSFTITEKNDPPVGGPNLLASIAEDASARTIAINSLLLNDTPGPTNESSQTLTLTAVGNAVGGTVQIDALNQAIIFTPTPNFNGLASFTYTIEDDGTTAGNPDVQSATATVSFTITEQNDAPTGMDDFHPNIAEDSAALTIPSADLLANDVKGPANESGQILTLGNVLDAIGGTVEINGSDVIFTPFDDYHGPAGFTYTFQDDGTTNSEADPLNGSASVSFTIWEVNDPPTAGADSLNTITEDFGPFAIFLDDLLANDVAGPADESEQTLELFEIFNIVGGTAVIAGSQATFTPAEHYNGPAGFVYRVRDNGTTEGQADPQISTGTVSFTIAEVNDDPIGSDDPLLAVAEDSGPRIIPFASLLGNDAKGPANETGQTLTIVDVLSAVGGTVEIVDETVVFTPAGDYFGQAGFTYTLQDNGTSNGAPDFRSARATVTFTITEVNDAPTGTDDLLSNVQEDFSPRTITIAELLANDSKGPANEGGQTLTMLNVGSAVGGSVQIVGTDVIFSPTPDYHGPASFVYTLTDDGATAGSPAPQTATATVSFTITEQNDPPRTTNDLLDTINEDFGPLTIPLADLLDNDLPGPDDESDQELTLFEISNVIGGTAEINGTQIIFTPTDDFNGTASFVYTVRDDGTTAGVLDAQTATATVTFLVTETNDAPIGQADELAGISEDFGPRVIPFADLLTNDGKGPANEAGQSLTIIDVLSAVGGDVEVDDLNQTVIFTPADNYNGPASFVYLLEDNGTTEGSPDFLSSLATVTFNISAVNDAPAGQDDTLDPILEDADPITIPFSSLLANDSRGPTNESGQSLVIIAVDDPIGGTVAIDGTNIIFTPTPDYFGTASFSYTLEDNGLTNGVDAFLTDDAVVQFEITPVNDPPSFQIQGNGNQSATDENLLTKGPALEQIVSGWAQNIDLGPANEGNTTQFVIENDNNGIFATQPSVDPDGTLRYKPMPNAHGVANVTVRLFDGQDNSAPIVFTIEITKPNKLHNASESGKRTGLDVTGSTTSQPDGFIVAGDVLGVINYINAQGSGPVPASAPFGPPYPDTNGDNQVAADDVIAIINYLNAGNPSEAEGEAAQSLSGEFFSDFYFTDLAEGEATSVSQAVPAVSPPSSLSDLMALLATDAATAQSKRRRLSV